MTTYPNRIRGLLCALLLPFLLGACDSLLSVDNPSIIEGGEIMDPELVDFIMYGVVGEFQAMYTVQAFYSGALADELIDGHVYQPHRPHDLRQLEPTSEFAQARYSAVHSARGTADSLSARIETLLGDSASTSLRLARPLAYAGYTYVVLGEQFCSSPIDASEAYTSEELLGMAIPRFDRAIEIATAAKGAGANAASADSIINLARVGAARAFLGMDDDAQAVEYASQVPADFEFWIAHSDNSSREDNYFYGVVPSYAADQNETRWGGIGPAFADLNDLRVPHTDSVLQIMDTREFYVPFQSSSFSEWSPGTKAPFLRTTDLRFSSGLEARYIVAEAGGMSDAELLAFINERRAVGGQDPVSGLSHDELMAELRDQRRRDFFMDGHRLGDLRRYKAQYGIDLFPKGIYPQTDETYGDTDCYPISSDELNSNPNV